MMTSPPSLADLDTIVALQIDRSKAIWSPTNHDNVEEGADGLLSTCMFVRGYQ